MNKHDFQGIAALVSKVPSSSNGTKFDQIYF